MYASSDIRKGSQKSGGPMNIESTKGKDAVTEDRALTIRDALRDAIMDRRLAPGARLVEAEVGALFHVSRTVSRAALQMLAFEGLVRIERNRGAFVSHPSPEEARQVFAARRVIEPAIVAAAMAHLTAEDIAALRRQLKEEARHLGGKGTAGRRAEIQASGDFHLMLASRAGNEILKRFMDELVARSSLVIALYGRSAVSSCGHSEHLALLDAIEAKDEGLAEELMLRHIEHMEADLDLRSPEPLSLRDALALQLPR